MPLTPENFDIIGNSRDNYIAYKRMNSGFFTLNWLQIKSALVTMVLSAILGIIVYIQQIGDIFKISGHSLVNLAVFAAIPTVISLLKSLLTTSEGKVLGLVKVK